MEILIAYGCVVNVAAFLMMGSDKHRARLGKRRIPEKTLFLMGFLGGAAGIWWGMRRFRHKTLHAPFRYGIPLLTTIQLFLGWWVIC